MRLLIKLADFVTVQQLVAAPQIQHMGVWFSFSFCCSLADEFREMVKKHLYVDPRVLEQLQQCSAPLLQQLCANVHEAASDSNKHAIVLRVMSSWGNRLGINCASLCSSAAEPLLAACIHGLLHPPPMSALAGEALSSVIQSPDITMRHPADEAAFIQKLLQKLGSLHSSLSTIPHSQSYVAIASVLLEITTNHANLMAARADLSLFVLDFGLFILQHPSRACREIVLEIFDSIWEACCDTSEKVYRSQYPKLLTALVVDCVPYPADFLSWESCGDDEDDFLNHRIRLRSSLRDCCHHMGIGIIEAVLSSLPQQFSWQQLEAVCMSLNAVSDEWIHIVNGDTSGVAYSTCIPRLMSFLGQHIIMDQAANTSPLMLQARLSLIESYAQLLCRPGCELRGPAIQLIVRFLGCPSTLAASAAALEKMMNCAKTDLLSDINALASAIGSCMPTIRMLGPRAARSAHCIGRALSRSIDLLPSCEQKISALMLASESTVVQLRTAAAPAPGFQSATAAAATVIDIDYISGLCRFISPSMRDGIRDISALMQPLQVWWPVCSQAALASGSIEVVERLCDMVKVTFHALMREGHSFLTLAGPALVSILQSLHVPHALDAA
jgi:hypothetical protein